MHRNKKNKYALLENFILFFVQKVLIKYKTKEIIKRPS